MMTAIVEMFMSEYFLIKAVIGKYCGESEVLFKALRKICLISEKEEERLYALAENEIAKGIITDKDFMQYQRMLKYSRMIGAERNTNAEWEEAARIKGDAILTAHNYHLVNADASRNVVYNCLVAAATCGNVSAIRIMGILQCEGIFLKRNRKEGLKLLAKAADWNDCVSTLAILHYCKDTREYNMARLKQNVKNSPYEELYEVAASKYGEAGMLEIDEVKLLNKSFNSGVLKRDSYDPKYARILNSYALYVRDKEKAVFTLNKEQLCAISDLPLKLSPERVVGVDTERLERAPLKRNNEITAISRQLQNGDLRGLPNYRPLCLCCEDRYVLETYAKVIGEESESVHVEVIDISELEEYDFEPSPNNVFIRSIDEDKDNRFLLFFCGEISARKMDAVKSILQSTRRAKFHLHSPNVTLNLSAILPICFCDEENAKWLKSFCDEIKISEVTAQEQHVAIADILDSKQKLYGVGTIELAEGTAEILSGYGIDMAEKVIDSAVRSHREKGARITLSPEMLQEYAGIEGGQTIGFGGGKYARYH